MDRKVFHVYWIDIDYKDNYVEIEDEITDFFLNIKYTASNIVDYLDDIDIQKGREC